MKIKGRQQIALLLFLLGMICLLSGSSYAFYKVFYEGRVENKLEAGSFAVAFGNNTSAISLTNAYPMSDEEGLKTDPFTFSVANNGTVASKYQISIVEDKNNTLNRSYLKYSLKVNDDEPSRPEILNSLVLVGEKTLASKGIDTYELRIWLDKDAPNETMNLEWRGKVQLVAHDESAVTIEDHIAPTIEVEGTSTTTVHLGDSFNDPQVKSVNDNIDGSMDTTKVTKRYEYYDGDKVSTVTSVDTTKEGVYIIYYEILDSQSNKGVTARTVNVVQVNKSAPTITLVGDSTLTYAKGNYYVELGATAEDEQHNDLTNQIIIIHNLNLNTEDTQVVKYFVIDKDGNIGGATRTIKVNPAYKDGTNANEPKIVEGMIPVKYENGNWVKVDMLSDWYNYGSQKWANAVTVSETRRKEYQTAANGTPIDMNDINTMWVWIPRYEYMLTNLGTQYAGGTQAQPGAIGINFISGTSSKVSDEDNYKMHPAFTFGDEELTGIWYGKFETSNKEKNCTPSSTGDVNIKCDLETLTPQIKPGVTSWRGIRPSTAFTVSRKMEKEYADEYGFNDVEIDTHMSKNSEWGAVAYLSQSKYGKYGKDKQEVYINNCLNDITGIAGDTASASQDSGCANTYNTEAGQKASTTGNITGVYDMSGGAWEYVMGALSDGKDPAKPRSGNNTQYNSGFNGVLNSGDPVSTGRTIPEEKYYDLYTNTTSASACGDGQVCYGHALSETEGWYGDYSTFVSSTYPWFARGGGGSDSSIAGVFASNVVYGYAGARTSFRLVLVSTGA